MFIPRRELRLLRKAFLDKGGPIPKLSLRVTKLKCELLKQERLNNVLKSNVMDLRSELNAVLKHLGIKYVTTPSKKEIVKKEG